MPVLCRSLPSHPAETVQCLSHTHTHIYTQQACVHLCITASTLLQAGYHSKGLWLDESCCLCLVCVLSEVLPHQFIWACRQRTGWLNYRKALFFVCSYLYGNVTKTWQQMAVAHLSGLNWLSLLLSILLANICLHLLPASVKSRLRSPRGIFTSLITP